MNLDSLIVEAEEWEAQDRPRKAIECYDKAITFLKEVQDTEGRLKRAECYQAVGTLWRLLGNHKLTGEYYRLALADLQFVFSNECNIKLGEIYFLLGSFMEQLWKKSLAREYYEKSYLHIESCLGASHAHAMAIQNALARCSK